ncbi:alpha/beta hydrolase [Nonomuraea sp. NN258]|uniref:alpha/beta fold hydrolase n=1 Tax=Nonomuraea antri TaxID=2730852 RepID=UPI001568497D|nr:alpha/beta hydrolase [Nonomuraea antri]NRQ37248.1 alpha/beta hydrolase [Nonomuraea antri]
MTTTHTLDVPGARLHYEVRGTGPLLLITGAPMGVGGFAMFADAMSDDHTVVTHDPRGIGASRLDDPDQDSTPDLRADDLAALLDALGAESADVFGSSGGAVTALALATRHPARVRTVLAHEPPLLQLLPDAPRQNVAVEEMVETCRRDGPMAAIAQFTRWAGFEEGDEGAPVPQGELTERDLADVTRFYLHEIRHTTRYQPDLAALRDGPVRVEVGVGTESARLMTYQASVRLTELLGRPPVVFPGDHGGFIGRPKEFAEVLRTLLEQGRR